MRKAIVLLSGGLDSATALYLAKSQGYNVNALSFEYGQKHNKELESAKKIVEKLSIQAHKIVSIDISLWGHSALTDSTISVPDHDKNLHSIPVTYVPARNMIFLSIAASYAEAIGAQDIFIGVSQVDYSGYVDCRESFIKAMENTINLGTSCAVEHNRPIKLHSPFMYMSKCDEIKLGMTLGVDYSLSWSCYRGGKFACGKCDSCVLRLEAFKEAGIVDPIKYEK